uniref:PHD-type domain-containing protein n=1 Tax=Amphiprion percula TaxID=161767 RepID=A0A3P8U853_AMPPE
MEENVGPELSLAPEPEQSQDRMDSYSQGLREGDSEQKDQVQTGDDNVAKELLEEPEKSSKATSEVKKTWGFRRSTVAKREMPVEAATDSPENRCPVRRSGRQPKRTDKLEEFLLTTKRGSRKSAPPSLESGDPPSQTPTDAETASEASFDGNADCKVGEEKAESPERRTRSGVRKQAQRKTGSGRQTRGGGGPMVKDEGSSENEDDCRDAVKKDQSQDNNVEKTDEKSIPTSEDVGSNNAVQAQQVSEKIEGVEEKNEHEDNNDKVKMENEDDDGADKPAAIPAKRGPIRTYINKKRAVNKNTMPVKALAAASANKNTAPVKKETKLRPTQSAGKISKPQTQEDDDENDSCTSSSSSSSSSVESDDDGGYDPNALYCICRQKHNKRFMICCDRCEEWFHGDCVGITEARGRLMERNGEDYICPNCTAKKNQVVRPATSILSASVEVGRPKMGVSSPVNVSSPTTAERTNTSLSAVQGVTGTPSTTTGTEEKAVEDLGIKGRIEKATHPTGKKKIKIFQPALQQPAEPKADQKATSTVEKKATSTAEQKATPDTEQKVASNVEVKTTPTGEPTEGKTMQKAEDDSSLPKCIGPGCDNNAQPDSVYCGNDCILRHAAAAMKSITDEPQQKDKANAQKNKSTPKWSGASGKKGQKRNQGGSDSEEDHSNPDEDDEDEHAEEHPPPPATASWSSDHNYIAVTPEKTTPMSPTVLNKKCMYLFEGLELLLKPHCCSSIINVVAIMLTFI